MPEPSENKDEKLGEEDKVTVTKEFMDDLRGQLKALKEGQGTVGTRVESLLQEALTPPAGREEDDEDPDKVSASKTDEELKGMTPSQIVELITEKVSNASKKEIKNLTTELVTIKVLHEMDRCDNKYEDFSDLKKEMQKEATANPYLNLEDAYLLVKQKRGEQPKYREGYKGKRHETKKSEEDLKKEREEADKLKRDKTVNIFGEKPGVSPSAAQKGDPKTIADAAKMAIKDTEKDVK